MNYLRLNKIRMLAFKESNKCSVKFYSAGVQVRRFHESSLKEVKVIPLTNSREEVIIKMNSYPIEEQLIIYEATVLINKDVKCPNAIIDIE